MDKQAKDALAKVLAVLIGILILTSISPGLLVLAVVAAVVAFAVLQSNAGKPGAPKLKGGYGMLLRMVETLQKALEGGGHLAKQLHLRLEAAQAQHEKKLGAPGAPTLPNGEAPPVRLEVEGTVLPPAPPPSPAGGTQPNTAGAQTATAAPPPAVVPGMPYGVQPPATALFGQGAPQAPPPGSPYGAPVPPPEAPPASPANEGPVASPPLASPIETPPPAAASPTQPPPQPAAPVEWPEKDDFWKRESNTEFWDEKDSVAPWDETTPGS